MRLQIDGRPIEATPGLTVLQAALAADLYIPALCAHPDLPPQHSTQPSAAVFHGSRHVAHDPAVEGAGGCGICAVDIEGQGRAPACATPVRDGMVVVSSGPEIEKFRRERLSAILARHPHACLTCAMREGCTREPCSMSVPVRERCCSLLGRCELQAVADYVGIDPATPRYVPEGEARITSEPLFDRDPELCIACGRCVRACASREVGALGWVRDSAGRRFVGPTAKTFAEADCRFCGSCVEVCPTGALMDRAVKPAERVAALVPCRNACPAGTDVPRYLRLVAEGQFEEAAAVVAERAPFVEILGHVCFHPCESACRRNDVNAAPVSICRVKREAGTASQATWASRLPPPPRPSDRSMAVIGAGPAGIMAAHVLRLLGHRVTLFEAAPRVGGALAFGIPPFRLPSEVVERETSVLVAGVIVRTNTPIGPNGITLDSLRRDFDAVVVATGAQIAGVLNVPGEDRAEVRPGLDLLRDVAIGGVSPDAYARRSVAVIGGGNVALDCARAALRLGASHVDLVCLERRSEMPAFAHEIAAAEEEGVRVHAGWGVRAFEGDEHLHRVELKKCVRVFDADGTFAPAFDENVSGTLPADAVVVAIGQRPDRSVLPRSLDGVFLAGDLATGPRSVIEAIASGREAALAADRYLGGAGVLDLRLSDMRGSRVLEKKDGFAALTRYEPTTGMAGPIGLGEVAAGLGAELARLEADRCLRCDLRLEFRQPTRPPKARSRFAFDAASAASVPGAEGVLRFYDAGGGVLAIVGCANMREEMDARLGDARGVATFEFEASPMYTQRQNELLSQYVELNGRMPPGIGGGDDVDDLF